MHCLNDVCPHRGAPLSQGWVSEVQGHDCVVCPYHGWAFDEEGVLRDVPAAEKAEAWPRKQLVDSYAVQEKVCHECFWHAVDSSIHTCSASADVYFMCCSFQGTQLYVYSLLTLLIAFWHYISDGVH